jgi:hypothetical protein
MQVLEFTDSSAIAKIQFDDEQNQVGIAYTYKPDKIYVFKCDDVDFVKNEIKGAESVGKLVSALRKDGTLISV